MNASFLGWLAGFTDGDGHFGISSRGYCIFRIALAARDEAILYEIEGRLHIGSVGHMRTRGNPGAYFSVTNEPHNKILRAIFDEHPLRAKKRHDYEIWRKAVLAPRFQRLELAKALVEVRRFYVATPEVLDLGSNDAFGHWLAGFTDAEGCFQIVALSNRYNCHGCNFGISIRADDENVLRAIQRRTGLGRVYPRTDRRAVTWHVSRAQDCLGLVQIFDRYPLRTRKREEYLLWKRAVLAKARINSGANQVTGPNDWSEMRRIRSELAMLRRPT